jgi:hypothetical protein
LQQRHRGSRQARGVSVHGQAPAVLHTRQTGAQMCLPAFEAIGKVRASAWIALGELTNERSDWTPSASFALLLQRNQRAEPPVNAGPVVQMIQQLVLREQDGVRGGVDDGANEIVAIVEVVIELAAARVGAVADVIEAHRGRALLGHQLGRRLHDPRARALSFCSQHLWHADIVVVGLDSPTSVCSCFGTSRGSTREATEIAGVGVGVGEAAFKSRLHQARASVRALVGDAALVASAG